MLKRIIPALLAAALLTCSAMAAENVDLSQAAIQEESTTVTIREITPEQHLAENKVNAEIPDILPLDVEVIKEDGVTLLVKTFEMTPDADPEELVEENPVRNNVEYRLREITKQQLEEKSETKTAADNVTVSAPSEKKEDILPMLPEFVDYNEDGYSGKLLLDESSIRSEVEDTEGYSYTVKDTRQFTCLDRNDPYLIPKNVDKNGVTLSLADIKWSSGNENTVEGKYSATATYTGKAYGSKPGSYLITASYSGEVSKAIEGNVQYKVIYEPIPAPILPEGVDWGKVFKIIFIVIGSLGAAILLVLGIRKIVPKIKQRKKQRSEAESFAPPPRPTRRKAQGFIHMQRSDEIDNA